MRLRNRTMLPQVRSLSLPCLYLSRIRPSRKEDHEVRRANYILVDRNAIDVFCEYALQVLTICWDHTTTPNGCHYGY